MINKEKDIKLPLKRIISNNFFMIKMMNKASPGLFLINILFNVWFSLSDFIFYTLMLRYIINGIGRDIKFLPLVTTLLVWLVLQIIMRFLSDLYYQKYYSMKLNEVFRYVHTVVYKKAEEVELGCYENPKFYDGFVKAISECQNRTGQIINTINQVVYRVVHFSADFILLTVIDPFLLLFVILPVLVAPLKVKFNKIAYSRTVKTQINNRRRDYSQRVFYLADYAKELRLTNMPGLMIKCFREASLKNMKILKEHGVKLAVMAYISAFISEILAPLGATFYSVWKTLGVKTMAYGDCVVVINSIDNLANTLTNSADILMKFQENALFIENLREFLSYEPKIKEGELCLKEKGSLVLNNVFFKYDGAKDYTLKNVSIEIGPNEKVAIVGHNGAGKSTLVKLLLRLYDPTRGSITYAGQNVKNYRLKEFRNAFSVVMQDFHIFAMSVFDNVMLKKHNEENREKVKSSLEKSGLYPKIESFANKEDTIMTREFDDKGEQLSGGEQQKLAIAHVYSKENRFVILDEPSSALDPIAEYEMYERMREACKDCGIIFISHRLSSAVTADKIYLMEDGTVAESGTHRQLMEKKGKYASMFLKQAENYGEVE
ncbi:MAG: ABC transporter ATP-binding protein [Clostridia bacterium]|nr:ABC transporter ATP-binding protein [Clostridia bacterium]